MNIKTRFPHWRIWASAIVMAFAAGVSGLSAATLIDQGKSRYRIVVSAVAIPSERYAAEELQRYLERMSGARLPIVTDAEPME
ncbi:MAG: hypothetical protein DME19_19655 [Verrucomicrobia bacterium]|nr:MAG: hypothetical protein DME19_19655 [Verrucomicrobiota bacterium]